MRLKNKIEQMEKRVNVTRDKTRFFYIHIIEDKINDKVIQKHDIKEPIAIKTNYLQKHKYCFRLKDESLEDLRKRFEDSFPSYNETLFCWYVYEDDEILEDEEIDGWSLL